jgi:hypothetical protein
MVEVAETEEVRSSSTAAVCKLRKGWRANRPLIVPANQLDEARACQ